MADIAEIAASSRLAIVGVAKNCGKTTTLNYLMGRRTGDLPGLVSIGVDGEREDVLLGTFKPPIAVKGGQWVATAEKAAQRSSAHLEYVRNLGIETPMGDVIACRVLEDGNVMLAGLRHRREVQKAVDALIELGANAVWIDGAYGRVAGAHPAVSGTAIVSTGAVVGATVDDVVKGTEDLVSRLMLPEIKDGEFLELARRAQRDNRVYLFDENEGGIALADRSALIGLGRARKMWTPSVRAIAIPGLVSDGVARELLAVAGDRTLLLPDATVLHMEGRRWRRLSKTWRIEVADPVSVVGISYNPSSPAEKNLSAVDLERALSTRWPELVIFDPYDSRWRLQ